MPPFTNVTNANLERLIPAITLLISKATFIAVDTEFTALPSGPKHQNMQSQYESLKAHVEQHALVALGMSIFIQTKSNAYKVYNFSFGLLQEGGFKVCSKSMLFLVENGLDFNALYRDGISFVPGADVPATPQNVHTMLLRRIFNTLILRSSTLVLHNGLLDLLFLYNSFYAILPSTLESFTADLSEMFGGIYDTKYVSEYAVREKATFLSYIWKRILNEKTRGKADFVSFDIQKSIEAKAVMSGSTATEPTKKRKHNLPFCSQFARYGFCGRGRGCNESHDLDVILDYEDALNSTKRSKTCDEDVGTVVSSIAPDFESKALPALVLEQEIDFERFHSAPFDAYMTGYIHAFHRQDASFPDTKNRIFLMGRDLPLRIVKSIYGGCSMEHIRKMKVLRGDVEDVKMA